MLEFCDVQVYLYENNNPNEDAVVLNENVYKSNKHNIASFDHDHTTRYHYCLLFIFFLIIATPTSVQVLKPVNINVY